MSRPKSRRCLNPAPQRLSAPLQVRDPDRYDVLGEHGRGGLGKVARAHDKELGRNVAIKELIKRGDVGEVRFLREALITARLEHPGIVPIHEAGRWPDGTPFYVMKLVAGRSLKELLAERRTVEQRIALLHHVVAVADAVAYAHKREIIHRDLKPANVIVGDFGETVVIDWGLAKDLSQQEEPAPEAGPYRAAALADLTETGAVLGTPTYMPPEQWRGEAVDQRADVFAIGAMLWELCSTSKVPPTDPRHRDRLLREAGIDKDLCAILVKALSPEPERRYRNAGELAADLNAFTSGARIASRRYSLIGLVVHWMRRHRALSITVVAASVLAATGTIVAVLNIASARDHAETEQRRAEDEQRRAEHSAAELVLENASLLMTSDPTSAVAALAKYRGDDIFRKQRLLAEAYGRGVAETVLQPHNDRIWFLEGERSGAIFSLGADRRIRVTENGVSTTLVDDVAQRISFDYASHARMLAYTTRNGKVALLELKTRKVQKLNIDSPVAMSLSPDGTRLAIRNTRDELIVWSLAPTLEVVYKRSHFVSWSFLFDGANRILGVFGDGFQSLSLNGEGDFKSKLRPGSFDVRTKSSIVAGYDDGTVALLSRDLSVVARIIACKGPVAGAMLTSNDHTIIFACHDGVVGSLRFEEAKRVVSLERVFPAIGSILVLNADDSGRWIVASNKTNMAYVYDVMSGLVAKYEGQATTISQVKAQSREFDRILVGDFNGNVRVWQPPANDARLAYQAPTALYALAITADNREIVVGGQDGILRSVDIDNDRVTEFRGHSEPILGLRATPDGILSYSRDGTVRAWNHGLLRTFSTHGAVSDVSFDPRRGRVVSAGGDGRVFAWTMNGRDEVLLFEHSEPLIEIEVLRDSSHIVTNDGLGGVWDVSPEGDAKMVRRKDGVASILRASRDGRLLAVGTSEGNVEVYDTTSWMKLVTLSLRGTIRQMVFDPESREIIVASEQGLVRPLALDARRVLPWHEFPAQARDVVYHPSGDMIAFVCADGGTWIYAVPTNTWAYTRDRNSDTLAGWFSRDGKAFVSIDLNNAVIVRDVSAALNAAKLSY